ncbi:MAG: hypothetical protein P8M16_01495 [Acidimicrobiales bacterium]|nr:hypothetical protein [Acidimicrobiales bacterium]
MPAGTRVGTWDRPLALVDSRATVWPLGQEHGLGHQIEWWIGADDRWYAPAIEAGVRQVRPGPAPVLETRMRVSGGDIVATTWAAQPDGSSGPAVVVELTNEASVPVAVAVAVQASAGGRIRRVAVDGRRLIVDGVPSVVLDRDPGRFSLVDSRGDLWAEVTGGLAVKEVPEPVRCRIGAAAGALIVPLPHRTAMRFAVPTDDLVENPSAVLPPVDRVAAGWEARLEAATAVDLPDGVDVHRALVDTLLADSSAAVVVELARWGFGDEAAHRLGKSWLGSGIERLEATAALWTLARETKHFDGSLVVHQGLSLEEVIRLGGDSPEGRCAAASLVGLFEAIGDPTAAADALLLGGGLFGSGEPALSVAAVGPAAELRSLADRLVRRSSDGLDLLVDVPDAWLGQPVEVHGLFTPVGRLGFAIRWHGTRPAFLWQLEPHLGEGPVVLRVPGLDSAFSSSELAGEALLAAPAGRLPRS